MRRRRACGRASQIEHVGCRDTCAFALRRHFGPRHLGARRRVALRCARADRGGIPFGPRWIEEAQRALPLRAAQRAAETLVDFVTQHLPVKAEVLELPPHRVYDEDGVLGKPSGWSRAEQQVFPGTRAQACQTVIHPARIGLNGRALLGCRQAKARLRHLPEAEYARGLVLLQSSLPDKLRQFAGGEAPRQIHLEEPVLSVDEPRAVGKIGAVGRLDRRHAQIIPVDADRRRQRRRVNGAVELRQGSPQERVSDHRRRQDQHRDCDRDVLPPSCGPSHRVRWRCPGKRCGHYDLMDPGRP